MDPLTTYREAIERVPTPYTRIPYAYGDLRCEALFDREHDRYALITVGRHEGKRVHFVLALVDLIDGKVWIEKDNTEDGIAPELAQAGIPKSSIVLASVTGNSTPVIWGERVFITHAGEQDAVAFRPPEVRKHTEYAVA